MKHTITTEDITQSIEFELAQNAISRTQLGEGLSAVRQFQNKARIEIFQSDKLLKDTRALINQQYQINDMHLTLLQEVVAALQAIQLDVRRLGPSLSGLAVHRETTIPPQPGPHSSVSELPSTPRAAPPLADQMLEEGVFDWPSEPIENAMTPTMLAIKMDVRPVTIPVIGSLIRRVRMAFHSLTLFYLNQLSQKQTNVNGVYGDRLLELSQLAAEQQQQIEELTAQVAALQVQRPAES